MNMKNIAIALLAVVCMSMSSGNHGVRIALLKYNGGGDWYCNPTALTNLIHFCNTNLQMNLDPEYATVEVGSPEIFNYPFIHMTGHGNVVFSDQEAQNLRNYLIVQADFFMPTIAMEWTLTCARL